MNPADHDKVDILGFWWNVSPYFAMEFGTDIHGNNFGEFSFRAIKNQISAPLYFVFN